MKVRGSKWSMRVALGAGVLMASTAQAQQSSVLMGTVKDAQTGQVLPNVQVVVTSNSLQGEQTVETDVSGSYRIPNLPAGTYTIQFFFGGYRPFSNPQPIVLRTGQTLRFNAPLLAENAQSIEVVVEAPLVDVTRGSTGSSLDQEFIQKVPLVSAAAAPTKSFEAVAVATPGAQSDRYGTSIAGTTSPENGYRVDGVSVGNPAFGTNGSGISVEFLSEVQVISSGYMPEYGRTTGGTISATTRSGSNAFHGTVWLGMSPGAFEGRREKLKTDSSSLLTQTELSHIGDVGFVVDGPIIKDKLWFGTGVQLSQQQYNLKRSVWARQFNPDGSIQKDEDGFTKRLEVPGSEQQLVARARQLQAFGKLTYAINQDNRLSLTAFYNPTWDGDKDKLNIGSNINRRVLNGTLGSTAGSKTSQVGDVALHWLASADNKRWNFETSAALHREAIFTRSRDRTPIGQASPFNDAPRVIWGAYEDMNLTDFMPQLASNPACAPRPDGKIACEARNYTTGGPGQMTERISQRIQLRHSTSRTFLAAGHHVVKAGLDFEFLNYWHTKAYSGRAILRDDRVRGRGFAETRAYSFLVGPDQVVLSPYLRNKTNSQAYGLFLQDAWSIMDKVTLNAGIRYDGVVMYSGDEDKPFVTIPVQVAPRVGLVWDPTQKGRAKLFAQYARYYQGMSLDIVDRMAPVDAMALTSHDPAACVGLKDDPLAAQACLDAQQPGFVGSSGRTGNRMTSPYLHTRTPMEPNLKAQSSDEFSAGGEYNVFSDAKIGLYYQKRWQNHIIEDMSRDGGASYFIANPCRGIASEFPCAARNFDAMQLVFSKLYKDHWLARASYQWSSLRGNISGLFKPETGQLDPNITSEFDLPSLLVNRKGALPADRTHEIKLFAGGDYPVNERISVDGGVAINTRSGSPTNYLGSHQVYGRGESFLLVRGAGDRMPWRTDLNLNLTGAMKVGQSGRLALTLEMFNLFNFQRAVAQDQIYANDDGIVPIPDSSDIKALEAQVDKVAQQRADEANVKAGVAGTPNDPKFVTMQDIKDKMLNPNFGQASQYQDPRSFRFTLRYQF